MAEPCESVSTPTSLFAIKIIPVSQRLFWFTLLFPLAQIIVILSTHELVSRLCHVCSWFRTHRCYKTEGSTSPLRWPLTALTLRFFQLFLKHFIGTRLHFRTTASLHFILLAIYGVWVFFLSCCLETLNLNKYMMTIHSFHIYYCLLDITNVTATGNRCWSIARLHHVTGLHDGISLCAILFPVVR